MSIQFHAELSEFANAAKSLLVGRPRGKKVELEFVDVNAKDSEVELVSTGTSVSFPADIKSAGYARIPYPVFERTSKSWRTLSEKRVLVLIDAGRLVVGPFSLSHPEISVRLIGTRIADLPIDAPLPEKLILLTKFTKEELEDSGLLAVVMDAEQEAASLIDHAHGVLKPLVVTREALSEFVWAQIRSGHKSAPPSKD